MQKQHVAGTIVGQSLPPDSIEKKKELLDFVEKLKV